MQTTKTGCGSAWLERLVWDQEVAGSNPVTPICVNMRVQFNGRTPAFQAGYVGSIPITRFPFVNGKIQLRIMCSQLSWIEQRPSKPWVGGSNPFEHIRDNLIIPFYMVGIAQLVSAPDCGSGGPGFESQYPPLACGRNGILVSYIGLSPSGKAQHFDCCIRWFESSQPCFKSLGHQLRRQST